MRPNMVLAIHT